MEIISGVYKITNTITGDFYIGSSKNVKQRLAAHKCKSVWKNYPNKQLYQDMQKYGVDSFAFEILAEVEPEELKEKEQYFIETLKPSYNNINAKGLDTERIKKSRRKAQKQYQKSDKGKEAHRKASNKYNSQLCYYNGEVLKLYALSKRFRRAGVEHPQLEAKKYLLKQ